ncbi:hypothetical protein GLOTRDRAFT_128244 [Gloeophyllum trabeum ATCC 11539]|uniref:Uncharacterized protein n=1 Tax=Gloeophyllum trabeum (strain ATCC 11539 / FP-39264 / Madison 617) TaxID=670483 RepID=S7QA91_GLOTA|nr:uncharacterized protein GLOTRDRAFT_128244 [Gloeophyllum trabeum ATCC 11539]EPQ56293.1 hypothetical protein GLOTRDRAFT_128244 [Gloeophyllum trabeum ATCC 11539]
MQSPQLELASRAKLSLDMIPDASPERAYRGFTNTLLAGLARFTTDEPGATNGLQPSFLEVGPQPPRRVCEDLYAIPRDKRLDADESLVTQISGSAHESTTDSLQLTAELFASYEFASVAQLAVAFWPDSEPIMPSLVPNPPGSPDSRQPKGPQRKIKTAPRSPDFLLFLRRMADTGDWSQLPYLAVENRRRGDTSVEKLRLQVGEQVTLMFKDYSELQTSTVSTLSLAGDQWFWQDWAWDAGMQAGIVVRKLSDGFKELFVLVQGEGGEYYDFTPEFKAEWRRFAQRLGMHCDAFY